MIPIRILEGTFGSVPLGDLELLRREARDGLCALCVIVHVCLANKSRVKFYSPAVRTIGFCGVIPLGAIRGRPILFRGKTL